MKMYIAAFLMLAGVMSVVEAAVDVRGPVTAAQMAPDGAFYFTVAPAATAAYCKQGWAGMNMFIPKDHPHFIQYYGIILTSLSKGKDLYIANIDLANNGSAQCDVTKTGYGLLILQ